jgi:hypothetical protein
MENRYEFKGDHAVLYINFRGTTYNCFVDNEDMHHLIDLGISWNGHTGKTDEVYVRGTLPTVNGKRRSVLLHRYLLNAPERMYVDHKDRNPMNNRRSNLSIVEPSESAQNKGLYSSNKSGHRGVYWHEKKQRWVSQVRVNGKVYNKTSKNKEDAIKAVEDLRSKHFEYLGVITQ